MSDELMSVTLLSMYSVSVLEPPPATWVVEVCTTSARTTKGGQPRWSATQMSPWVSSVFVALPFRGAWNSTL